MMPFLKFHDCFSSKSKIMYLIFFKKMSLKILHYKPGGHSLKIPDYESVGTSSNCTSTYSEFFDLYYIFHGNSFKFCIYSL